MASATVGFGLSVATDGSAVAANREDRTTAASDENFDTERDFVIAGQAVGGMHDVRPTPTKPHAKSKPAAELVANTV